MSVKPACRNVRPWHHTGKKRSPELTFTFPDSPVGRCQGDILVLCPWRTSNILSQGLWLLAQRHYVTVLNRGGLGLQLKTEARGRDQLFSSSWEAYGFFKKALQRDILQCVGEGSEIPSLGQTQGSSPKQMTQPSFGFKNKGPELIQDKTSLLWFCLLNSYRLMPYWVEHLCKMSNLKVMLSTHRVRGTGCICFSHVKKKEKAQFEWWSFRGLRRDAGGKIDGHPIICAGSFFESQQWECYLGHHYKVSVTLTSNKLECQ